MPKASRQTQSVPADKSLQKMIMVVDDDPIFRRMTRAFLEQLNYAVVEAENGLQALQSLRECAPDLIICDLSMPILNGIEFVEEMNLEYPSLPAIVVSATDDMSEVAKVLRFGIKDFLPKPITNYQHLAQAIENTLQENSCQNCYNRDFSSQWFRVDGGEMPDEQELHWHLEYLENHPGAARSLLTALLPDKDAKQGDWRCNYRLLQSADIMPVVFDYHWLMNGQFLFYLVNSGASSRGAIATTLLIRALFDDYLRMYRGPNVDLKDILELIEKGVRHSNDTAPVTALFGLADMSSATVDILPAGLECHWDNGSDRHHIEAGNWLGDGSRKNFITSDLSIETTGQLTVNSVDSVNFALQLTRGGE